MNLAIILSASLIILTKLADCYTTAIHINNNPILEQNKLARYFMAKFGVKKAIWLIFLITILITVISFLWVLEEDSFFYNVIFILIALILSVVQFSVAHQNYYHKENVITKYLLRIFNK